MKRDAHLSSCGRYRYTLTRHWGEGSDVIVFIGLNPSTADAEKDDPTMRRLMGFAQRAKYDGLVMLNLFAFRATKPRDMQAAVDPVGPENDEHIDRAVRSHHRIVACWGANGVWLCRDAEVISRVPNLYCFGVTAFGRPRHPLYLPADTRLIPFTGAPRK